MSYTWSSFKTAVKGLMSSASLNDTSVVVAVSEYVKGKIVLSVDKNPALAQAHLANWILERNRVVGFQTTLTEAEMRTEVGILLTVDSTRHGIQELIDSLISIALNELAGLAEWVDATIRQGVIDLEHYVEFYRKNHETRYRESDVDPEGEASRGKLPTQAMVWDAYYVRDGEPCVRMPVGQYDWQNRFDLTCGGLPVQGDQFHMAIEPNGETFLIFPAILEGHYLSVFWDGLKLEFEDPDLVPFDEGVAEAVANYVLAKLYLRPECTNAKLAEGHLAVYRAQRLQLFRNSKDMTAIRYRNDSPASSQDAPCAGGCAVVDTEGSFNEGVIPAPPNPWS